MRRELLGIPVVLTGLAGSAAAQGKALPATTPMPIKKIAVIADEPYHKRRVPRAVRLLRGAKYLPWAVRSNPDRLLVAEFASRRGRPRSSVLIDLNSRKRLARAAGPWKRELGVYATLYDAKGPSLLRVVDGKIFRPKVSLPGGRKVKSVRLFHSPDGQQVWVFASAADEETGYYQQWVDPARSLTLQLRSSIRVMPNAGHFNRQHRFVEVWRNRGGSPGVAGKPTLPGECLIYRLWPGKSALCRVRDPNTYGPMTQFLSGDWLAFGVSGSQRGGTFGDAHVLDTTVGQLRRLPAGRCGGSNDLATVLIHPARVLTRCSGWGAKAATGSTLWSPRWVRHWAQPPWRGIAFSFNVLRPVLALHKLDKPGRYWIDLERGVGIETPPLLCYHTSSTVRRPIAVRLVGNKARDLVFLDLNSYRAAAVARYSYRDCPRNGQSWARARAGDYVGVICQRQPNPNLFVFRHVWSEVFDLRRKLRWRLRGTIEHLLPNGKAIVSNRRRMASESYSATTRISLVTLR